MPFKRRDTLVCMICNFLLNHVASAGYRDFIGYVCDLGMEILDEKIRKL